MRGAWVIYHKAMGSTVVCSSLPVALQLNPELEPFRAAIYRLGNYETETVTIQRAPMYRPEDVR